MQLRKAALHAFLGAPRGERSQIGVGADLDATVGGVTHHVEQPGMEERLAETLQLEVPDVGELVEHAAEIFVTHESRGPPAHAFAPEDDRTHPAAQVALPDRLDLHEFRQRRLPVGEVHMKATLNLSAPRKRQYTESGGMSID